jgi:hypothetical protein
MSDIWTSKSLVPNLQCMYSIVHLFSFYREQAEGAAVIMPAAGEPATRRSQASRRGRTLSLMDHTRQSRYRPNTWANTAMMANSFSTLLSFTSWCAGRSFAYNGWVSGNNLAGTNRGFYILSAQTFFVIITIYAPMNYTAPCIMFWMRANPLQGEVGGGWALEFLSFLGPVKWHQANRLVPFGAQKTRAFQGPTPSHFPK